VAKKLHNRQGRGSGEQSIYVDPIGYMRRLRTMAGMGAALSFDPEENAVDDPVYITIEMTKAQLDALEHLVRYALLDTHEQYDKLVEDGREELASQSPYAAALRLAELVDLDVEGLT